MNPSHPDGCPKIFGEISSDPILLKNEDGLVVLTMIFYDFSGFWSGFLGFFFAWQQGKTWLKSEGLRLFGNS